MNQPVDKPKPPSMRALLDEYGLTPKRSLGQNFLADAGICRRIAELVCVRPEMSVIEIGAGLGALTFPLLSVARCVVAVETDPAMVEVLASRFAEECRSERLTLRKADARREDFRVQLGALEAPRALAGNLPYHLSGLLLRRVIDASDMIERGVFLLQLEVVNRLCAAPGGVDYGALSVFAQAVFEPRRAFVVKRGVFLPQPNVDSAVVTLTPRPDRREITRVFENLVRGAFGQRRKTLRNAWRNVEGFTAEDIADAAQHVDIDLGCRGETLSVDQFFEMVDALQAVAAAK